MTRWARVLGLTASLGLILLWSWAAYFRPPERDGQGFYANVVVMVALAIAAFSASLLGRPVVLLVAMAASFVPVGLYTLGLPSLFRVIGILDVLGILAGGLMISARRDRK
jgi:hypothetical protein